MRSMPRPPIFHAVDEAMGGRLLERISELRYPPKRSWDDIAQLISMESGQKVSRGSCKNWHEGEIPERVA